MAVRHGREPDDPGELEDAGCSHLENKNGTLLWKRRPRILFHRGGLVGLTTVADFGQVCREEKHVKPVRTIFKAHPPESKLVCRLPSAED
jgi:hypothetical protein